MKVITRSEARAAGLPKYFTGKPCPHGHIVERWTSSCCCVLCTAKTSDNWRKDNKDKVLSRKAERYAANPEPIRAKRRENYLKDPEKGRAASASYRLSHPEKVRESVRAYQAANPEKKRANKAKWDAANRDRISASYKKWRKKNPEKERVKQSNRRAGVFFGGGSYTEEDIAFLWETQKGRCAHPWCRARLTRRGFVSGRKADPVDHIIPLSKGGTNDRKNLQLLCWSCNSSKGAKHPTDFAQQNGMLL